MLVLYFSGTGNSRFIAELFASKRSGALHSIEEDIDFDALMSAQDTIAFCYPIYGSCAPRIMRDFVARHRLSLGGKRLIIFCTQTLFSGDGARVLIDLLAGIEYTVVYAEHFNMPNNICNFFLFPLSNQEALERYRLRAIAKMDRVCNEISRGIIRKRGFSLASRLIGFLLQRMLFKKGEKVAAKDVRITEACTVCGICVAECPTGNLFLVDGRIQQRGQCTLCYRCVNRCPQRALTVLWHAPVKLQYRGLL